MEVKFFEPRCIELRPASRVYLLRNNFYTVVSELEI